MRAGSRNLARIVSLVGLLVLPGCSSGTAIVERLRPKEEDAAGRAFLAALASGPLESVLDRLDPSIDPAAAPGQIAQMRELHGPEPPREVRLVGFNVMTVNGDRRVNLTYELQFEKRWLLAAVVVGARDGVMSVRAANLQPIADSLERLNAFDFAKAGARHYVFLALAVTIPLFIVFTIVVIVRSRVPRKWLWIPFAVLGLVQISLNWATGEIGFAPVSFLLFGASALRSGAYGPWIVSVALPVGAILFLALRSRLVPEVPTPADGSEG